MIYIGIDPAMSNTGIVVLNSDFVGKMHLWGSALVTCEKVPAKKSSPEKVKLMASWGDIPVSFLKEELISRGWPRIVEYVPDKEAPSLILMREYYLLCEWVFHEIIDLVARSVDSFKQHYHVGTEIPFGSHLGAGAKVDRMFALSFLAAQQALSEKRVVTFYEFKPLDLKKFATGKAKSPKETMIKEVFRRWGYDTDSQHLTDAYVVARYIRHLEGVKSDADFRTKQD